MARAKPTKEEPSGVGGEDQSTEIALHSLHRLPDTETHDVEEGNIDGLTSAVSRYHPQLLR